MKLLRTLAGNRDLLRIEAAWAAASLGNRACSILLALYAYREGDVRETIEVVVLGLGAVIAALLAHILDVGAALIPTGVVLPLVAALTAPRLFGLEGSASVPERPSP